MDNGVLQVNETPKTSDGRTVLGIIDIRVGDLLISGSSEFSEYISCGASGKSRRIAMVGINRLIWVCGLGNRAIRIPNA